MAPHSAEAEHGIVVSAHPLASRVGRDVLLQGGNAVDAAVAAAFALSVVEPYSSGLGGGGFMLICPGPGQEVRVLDYREVAPAAATRDMYVRGGEAVPGLSTRGALAVAVPGTVKGLAAALDRYGSMTLDQVISPALRLAREGFTVDAAFYERSLLALKKLREDECAAQAFLDRGLPYLPGSRIRQPDLARSLTAIAEKGPEVFYTGWIGRAIVDDLQAKGGIISIQDLADYQARWREPVRGTYRGYEIISMPPPSSGGAVLIETLNILEGFDLAGLGYHSDETVHIMAEAMRLSFADRAAFMGDPAFYQAPIEILTSKSYARTLREKISPDRAADSRDVTPGAGVIPAPGGSSSAGLPLDLELSEGINTTHLSVVDKNGMAVSLTQTINTLFGSGVVACGAGIVMNNEMDDFAALPGAPNAYGLVQGDANAIAPGKIPLSSMSPTMVMKNGRLFMVIGSPGGPRIITTVLQVIVNSVDFQMDVKEAVDARRIHHQWLPDSLLIEKGRLGPMAAARLASRGHRIKSYVLPCNAQAIMVLPDGTMEGASDPRGIGRPEGY